MQAYAEKKIGPIHQRDGTEERDIEDQINVFRRTTGKKKPVSPRELAPVLCSRAGLLHAQALDDYMSKEVNCVLEVFIIQRILTQGQAHLCREVSIGLSG